ncbi:MAG: flagellar trans-acting factor FliX [Sphingomonas sp.]|uniref:flagellar assembly protein FliX n=1 Tax=Sphingomonas sp. TaxID=28214 RepID=UPI001B2E8C40|nr:flagellar assembly protein FliX [Sphingomonas sp.]MBO9623729.1 flagellar trans-acting factor FliX [Sphingomonas sp.]
MRIEGLSPMLARSLLAALPKAAPGFPLAEKDAAAAAPQPPVNGPGGVAPPSVQMLVALAAADPQVERRRRMAVEAERGVDALERLHKELLAGVVPIEQLQEIAEWSQSFEVPDDPVLAQILSDIDLRVRVELAKIDLRA